MILKNYFKIIKNDNGERIISQISISDNPPSGYTEDLESLRAIINQDHIPDESELRQMEQMAQIAELQVSNAQKDATIIDMMAQIAELQLGGTK